MKRMSIAVCMLLSIFNVNAEVTNVATTKVTVPVFIKHPYNPVLGFTVTSDCATDELNTVTLSFKGTTQLSDISGIEIYHDKGTKTSKTPSLNSLDPRWKPNQFDGGRVGTKYLKSVATLKDEPVSSLKGGSATLRFNAKLEKGDNFFWVSLKVEDQAKITNRIALSLVSIGAGTYIKEMNDTPSIHRIGYAVTGYKKETAYYTYDGDKVATKSNARISNFFRIPGITRTNKGSLVAVFDNRYKTNYDLPGDIDVGISRSTDGGQTWSDVHVVMETRTLNGGNGVGDPAILTDRVTGRIWVSALWSTKRRGNPIWASIAGSSSVADCGQWLLAYSDDDGKTFSKPINITPSIKRLPNSEFDSVEQDKKFGKKANKDVQNNVALDDTSNWGAIFQGPGNGITMKDGTLVFPGQVWKKIGNRTTAYGVLVYSKDRGETWTSSNTFCPNSSESTIAELPDGSILFNARNESRSGKRVVGITKDMGETWEYHKTHNNDKIGLIEKGTCQGCLTQVPDVLGKKDVLFFSNPVGPYRSEMSIKYSLDDGNAWSKGLMYDQRACLGYSAIIGIDKDYLGVFYESESASIFFLKIPYSEILNSK